MAFCRNCGEKIADDARFCTGCGAPVDVTEAPSSGREESSEAAVPFEAPVQKAPIVNGSIPVNESINGMDKGNKALAIIDKIGKFWGIILFILALVDFRSDPPVLTILLSIAIIAGAIFCFIRKYKLKFFTVLALILAVICLLCGLSQGKREGYFTIPGHEKNKEAVEESVEEVPNTEKKETTEAPAAVEDKRAESVEDKEEATALKEEATEKDEKAAEQAEVETAPANDEEKSESADSDGVDPELKAFLDSYEEFMDEYVDFMKNYLEDPGNAVSMLKDYTRIMSKYAEFEEKVGEYDSKDMSDADARYYLKVLNRVNEKLMEVY